MTEAVLLARPRVQLRDLITAELASRAVYAAVELGIPDLLAGGGKTIAELAALAGADASALYRLMRFLASLGVFREIEPQRFESSSMGELLEDRPRSLRSFARMFASPWNQRPFAALAEAVRTGKSAFETSMGRSLFDYLREEPAAGTLFNAVMTDFLSPVHRAVAGAYNFSGRRIVDVGGGRGSLLLELLRRFDDAQGVLLDTPAVIVEARSFLRDAGMAERIVCNAGNFFDAVPGGGDIYLLCRVIHDWDDPGAIEILRSVRAAMRPDSRVLLVEQLMPQGDDASFVRTTDIWMLLMFHEGRERTEPEMRALLDAAGLSLRAIHPTEVHDVIIEAVAV